MPELLHHRALVLLVDVHGQGFVRLVRLASTIFTITCGRDTPSS